MYRPDEVWCQINESSAPVELGLIHRICIERLGKSSSILCLFHFSSEVRRSATVRSRASSLIGPIGFNTLSSEIHESFQSLIVWPFPIDFPKFSFNRWKCFSTHESNSLLVQSLGSSCFYNILPLEFYLQKKPSTWIYIIMLSLLVLSWT